MMRTVRTQNKLKVKTGVASKLDGLKRGISKINTLIKIKCVSHFQLFNYTCDLFHQDKDLILQSSVAYYVPRICFIRASKNKISHYNLFTCMRLPILHH